MALIYDVVIDQLHTGGRNFQIFMLPRSIRPFLGSCFIHSLVASVSFPSTVSLQTLVRLVYQ